MAPRTVAVLGCGPAGMLAAHAAQIHGFEVTIFAPEAKKSVISGAQFLHSAIPGMTHQNPDGHLMYEHRGDEETYAKKIYGSMARDFKTSWSTYPDQVQVPAWSLRQAYSALWRCYRHTIVPATIRADDMPEIAHVFDQVFSTAPRKLVQAGHSESETVWIKEYPALPCPEQTVVYSGQPEIMWYRMSSIFGHYSMEWPNRVADVGHGAVRIHKPLAFQPEYPAPANIHFVGRYGEWKKGVLVDHVFARANKILGEM